jgi:TRAP-type mannitol/chloroaromatic compound transport system substrate-binding protein
MERREFLKQGGAVATGVGATALAAPAVVTAQSPTLQWRLASSFPKSLDILYGTAEFFARRVSEMTGGRFQIRVHAGGEIVPPLQVLDAVQNGTIECGHTASYYYFGKNPAFAFDTTIPFGMNTRQHNAWMYAGGGLELMRELFKEYGCVNFPAGNTGAQMGGWFRKEIKSPADLKGLKMRIAGLAGQMLAKLGTVPQQIAGGEIYQALERGSIDAVEWTVPYDDEKLGLSKVAKYYYYPGFWEGTAQLSVLINLKKWEELPAEYKAIVEAAAAESGVTMTARYDAKNPEALRRLVAAGTQLRAFPRPVMEAARKSALELYEELSAKSPHFKKIYEAWNKFRAEETLWFRVSEHSFDSFMNSVDAQSRAAPAAGKGDKK